MLRVRYAQVPVVAAMRGIALGGGCEMAVHCARRVAAMESYIGLVEVGVGLIPGGGGLAYIARRAAEMASAAGANADLLQVPDRRLHQRRDGQGRHQRDRVAQDGLPARRATSSCRTRTSCCTSRRSRRRRWPRAASAPPAQAPFPVAGRNAIATIKAQLANMRDGGFVSAHDFHIATLIADVVCGGDVDAGSLVTEEYLMALEREALLRAARPPEDAGTDHGHAADRQAGAQLKESPTMSKQVQDAYIVAATRTPIGKSGRGYFRNTRPDDLLVAAILSAMTQVPSLDPTAIEDAIIGCSFPEAEQGMNMARIAVQLLRLAASRWAASPSTASAPRA